MIPTDFLVCDECPLQAALFDQIVVRLILFGGLRAGKCRLAVGDATQINQTTN